MCVSSHKEVPQIGTIPCLLKNHCSSNRSNSRLTGGNVTIKQCRATMVSCNYNPFYTNINRTLLSKRKLSHLSGFSHNKSQDTRQPPTAGGKGRSLKSNQNLATALFWSHWHLWLKRLFFDTSILDLGCLSFPQLTTYYKVSNIKTCCGYLNVTSVVYQFGDFKHKSPSTLHESKYHGLIHEARNI